MKINRGSAGLARFGQRLVWRAVFDVLPSLLVAFVIALIAINPALALAPAQTSLAPSALQVPLPKYPHTLVVGSEEDYPPFSTGTTDDTAGGFTVDLWKAVAAENGLKYTVRVRPFHQLLQEFKDGKIDVLINLAMSDERRMFADFTVPHVTVHGAIFTRKEEFNIKSEGDLTGTSIIVLKADMAHDYALTKGWGPRLVLVDTAAEGLSLLATGQHDAMLVSKLTGLQTLQKLALGNIKALPLTLGFSQRFAFATQRQQPDLLARLNEGLALTKANGQYSALHEKWFGLYAEKEISLHDVMEYIVPVVALFLLALGYLFYRRQVERNLSYAAIAHSRNLLLAIIDTAPVRVFWKDRNSRYLGCNPAFANDSGMKHPDDVIGKEDFQLGWAAQADQYRADDQAVMASGKAKLSFDEPQRASNGKTIWLRTSKVPLKDEHDETIGILGVYEDITQQKAAEQTMLDSNRLLQSILDNIPVGLSAFDKDLKLIAHNRLFQETLDFPDALFSEPNTTFERIIRFNAERGEYGEGDHSQMVQAMIERSRHPETHQFERVRPNGVTLEVRGAPMPGGGFVTTYADISERKRVEEAERRLTAQLCLDEERSHDFSLSASDWFWETDAEHRFSYFSDSFEQIYGVSPDLWLGKSRQEILELDRFNPPETVKAHLAHLAAHLPFKNFEYQVRRTDGEVIWASVSGVPHLDLRGIFAGYRGTGTLISERKSNEETLRQTAEALMESEERFKLIFNEAPIGIALVDSLTGRIHAINPVFAKMARKDVGEMTQMDWRSSAQPQYAKEDCQNMALLNDGKISGFKMEKQYLHEDGTQIWVNMTIAPVKVHDTAHPRHICLVEDITKHKLLEDQVHHLAFHDSLTQLPNRSLLIDRLRQAMSASKRSGRYAAVMFIDLDNFKPLNDAHGHEVGDLLLKETAARLVACVREVDTVARFGGDEFVVMLSDLDADREESVSQAGFVAEKIRALVAQPYDLTVRHSGLPDAVVQHNCTASIGVALFRNHDGSEDDILNWADKAMYQAKEAGRNAIRFFT